MGEELSDLMVRINMFVRSVWSNNPGTQVQQLPNGQQLGSLAEQKENLALLHNYDRIKKVSS